MSMLIEVWGDYACFTRPEMKTERVSYDMITPSAARGLVEAIYWHPGLRYTVDRIYLLKPFGLDPEDEASTEEYTQRPIRFTNIRRNEVKSTLLSSAALSAAKGGRRCSTPRRTSSSGPRWSCRTSTTSSSATLI
jgi:CRISPR-associated protein Cas5d